MVWVAITCQKKMNTQLNSHITKDDIYMIPQETIQEALARLVKAYDPLEIYMYGKYGWGTPDEDDDLNLLACC